MGDLHFDVAVIGGGIVGMATALHLAGRAGTSLVVLEAENRLAAHQTGHNSGVIHSGLYYRPGSLKARLCVEGREALYRYCAGRGIPHERCGKLVVATRDGELPRLRELERRGAANGLGGVRRLDAGALREHEPHVAGLAGLLVPDTGIVDFRAVCEAYADDVRARGGRVLTGARVLACARRDGGFALATAAGEVACRAVVNCAGLQSDRVARLCGVTPGVRIVPFRGGYRELVPGRRALVRNLIYPVPDPRFPFLGVHFTRRIDGAVEAGPDATLSFTRHGYRRRDFSAADALETLGYAGFWRLAARHGRMAFAEAWRAFSPGAFTAGLRRLVPEIRSRDLRPGGAGVRAQAVAPDGTLVDDFHIARAPGMIHVLNAPSPAATASLAIGRAIAGMAAEQFDLD